FVVREYHAIGGAGAGETNEMFRPNVRGEDRRANDPPTKMAAREEVVVCRVFALANHPQGKRCQSDEISNDDNPVKRCKVCHKSSPSSENRRRVRTTSIEKRGRL